MPEAALVVGIWLGQVRRAPPPRPPLSACSWRASRASRSAPVGGRPDRRMGARACRTSSHASSASKLADRVRTADAESYGRAATMSAIQDSLRQQAARNSAAADGKGCGTAPSTASCRTTHRVQPGGQAAGQRGLRYRLGWHRRLAAQPASYPDRGRGARRAPHRPGPLDVGGSGPVGRAGRPGERSPPACGRTAACWRQSRCSRSARATCCTATPRVPTPGRSARATVKGAGWT